MWHTLIQKHAIVFASIIAIAIPILHKPRRPEQRQKSRGPPRDEIKWGESRGLTYDEVSEVGIADTAEGKGPTHLVFVDHPSVPAEDAEEFA